YGWQQKREKDSAGRGIGERKLIPDLAAIPWQGRTVFICFDSDAATNNMVCSAERHLADALSRQGASGRIVRLPQGEPAAAGTPAKVGLDDYLIAHGADALRDLLGAQQSGTGPIPAIDGGTGRMAEITAEAWDALKARNQPPSLFRCGSVPSRIEKDDDGSL